MTTTQTQVQNQSGINVRAPQGKNPSLETKVVARAARAAPKPRLQSDSLSFNTCVKSISNVTTSRRGLLQVELAVGLAVFMDSGVVNKASKNLLNEVYLRAGYVCMDSSSKEYKNVNRRIQASAALFDKIGLEVINHWADQTKESKLLQAVAHHLAEFKFESLDDVHDYVGRKSNRTVKAAAANPFHIMVGKSVVAIPKTLTEAELIELASKILALAEEVRAGAAEGAAEGAEGVKVPLSDTPDAEVAERPLVH